MIYQCVFCGSFSLWVVGTLDPHDIDSRVHLSKLKRQRHDAEADIMLEHSRAKYEAKMSFLPCTTCIEYQFGISWSEILGDDWVRKAASADCRPSLSSSPIGLSPQVPVRFAAAVEHRASDDELPPVYRCLSGKWTLAQGQGPKVLDVKTSADAASRLPATQFKVLLKGAVYPLLSSRRREDCPQGASKAPSKTAPTSKVTSPSCSEDEVRRFLQYIWGDLPEYEERLCCVMIDEETQTYAQIGHYVVRPVFCSDPSDLSALEARLQVEA